MCGIAGAFACSDPDENKRIARLTDAMHHRGPDATTFARGPWWALGHDRLAIVDLTDEGAQPFVSADASVRCIYNGEIYNHRQLRASLNLRTEIACDGAILPQLWERYHEKCFDLLRGMFAIAVIDENERTLTLATDHFGIKPCYWARRGNTVYFASEARALATVLNEHEVSTPALGAFLLAGSVPADQSGYEAIHRVPPGTWITFAMDGGETRGALSDIDPTTDVQPDELVAAFHDSVQAHLMSDVPVGLLLSDGVDSTAIALSAARLGAQLQCITIDMGGARSSADAAAAVAKRCRADHEIVRIDPSADDFERYFAAMDRPTIDGLNTFLACRAVASQGLKVALSGAGADEVIGGGYRHHRRAWIANVSPKALNRVTVAAARRDYASRLIPRRTASGFASVGWPTTPAQLVAFARTVRHDHSATLAILGLRPAERYARVDQTGRTLGTRRSRLLGAESDQYLSSQLLPDSDSFSMASSVELRVPFTDKDFATKAWGLVRQRGGKSAFATQFDDDLIAAAAARRKEGFGVPMERWMREGPLADAVESATRRDAPVVHLIGQDVVRGAVASWRRSESAWSVPWSMVALNAWLSAG